MVTIEALAKAPYNVPANRQIKTLVYMAEGKVVHRAGARRRPLNEAKFAGKIGTTLYRPATAEEIFEAMGAHAGQFGRGDSDAKGLQAQVFADERLRGANGMTTGANEDGFHLRNVSIERDIQVSNWFDLRTVQAGEPCAQCGKPLKIRRAMEVGHVFKLGTKYSEKFNACYLDEAGGRKLAVMGCYGIGVTRTLQAVVEQCNDKDGIIWPLSVAPYRVCITPLNVDVNNEAMAAGGKDLRGTDRREAWT